MQAPWSRFCSFTSSASRAPEHDVRGAHERLVGRKAVVILLTVSAVARGEPCGVANPKATDVVVSVIHQREGITHGRDRIYIDGRRVAVLDVDRALCHRVLEVGNHLHSIQVVSENEEGKVWFAPSPGHQISVAVALSETAEPIDPARLVIGGLDGSVYRLQPNAPPVSLMLLDTGADDKPVPMRRGRFRVSIETRPGIITDITQFASVSNDSTLLLIDLPAAFGAIERLRKDGLRSCCRIELGAFPEPGLFFREQAEIKVLRVPQIR
jgi:hypothetical protein